jgi:hypothetical protein
LRQLSQDNALITKEENAKLAREIVDLTFSRLGHASWVSVTG